MNKQIPVECYSRVSGYFRPTQQWNKGKKEEFTERKYLDLEKAMKNEK
jgi:ribonucleoside-triphosphate reductase